MWGFRFQLLESGVVKYVIPSPPHLHTSDLSGWGVGRVESTACMFAFASAFTAHDDVEAMGEAFMGCM